MTLDVVLASAVRLPQVEAAIVEAMLVDPAWLGLFPAIEVRRAALVQLVRSGMAEATRAQAPVFAAILDDEVVGGLVAMPPERVRLGPGSYLRGIARASPFILRWPMAAVRTLRVVAGIQAHMPRDPVVYLEWVGVVPAAQGRGVGRALGLTALDAHAVHGVDFYLETTNLANVALYSSFGFELVRGPVAVHRGGPDVWCMRKPHR